MDLSHSALLDVWDPEKGAATWAGISIAVEDRMPQIQWKMKLNGVDSGTVVFRKFL